MFEMFSVDDQQNFSWAAQKFHGIIWVKNTKFCLGTYSVIFASPEKTAINLINVYSDA